MFDLFYIGEMSNTRPTSDVQAYCHLPYYQLIIVSDGSVIHCCDQKGSLGNIKIQSLVSIWNSPLSKEIRQAVSNGTLHPVCKSGGTCRYLNQPMVFEKKPLFTQPKILEICLPDSHCNIGGESPSPDNPACIMCKRNFAKPSTENVIEEACTLAKFLMSELHVLRILGTAEPFWKGAIFDVLDRLDFAQHKEHVEIVCNTNGICIVPKVARRFFKEVRISNVWWSFDAASPEVYKTIRRRDFFQHITKNFVTYNSYRRDCGLQLHKAQVYNNINMLNVREMPKMVEQAAEMGADGILFLPTMNYYPVYLPEITINENNKEIFEQMAAAAKEKAEQMKFRITFIKPFKPFPILMPILQSGDALF